MNNSNAWALAAALLGGVLAVGATPFHPADRDADGALSIEEVTAYAKAWVEGATWPAGPSPVRAEDVERARFIWRNGERYTLVAGVPVEHGWVPAPLDGTVFVTLTGLRPEPLDDLELFGLPSGLEFPVLEYRVEGSMEFRYGPLVGLETDRWALIVPYVPGAPGGAAPLELWVLDGEERFPVVPIRPVPLPVMAGTALSVAGGLADLAGRVGELLGGDAAQYYNAAPEAIPEELRPLVLIDRIVRDPENPNNLSQVLAGTAPLLQEAGIAAEDLDALLGKLGAAGQLAELQALVAAAGPAVAMAAAGAGGHSVASAESSSIFLNIQTLGQLADAMTRQCIADRVANPSAQAQSVKDKVNLASVLVGLAGPVGAAAAASYNVASWAIESYHQVIANQWPSRVSNGQLDFSPAFSVEDDCAPASWSATVDARSRDWSLDKVVVMGALNFLGAFKARSDILSSGTSPAAANLSNSLTKTENAVRELNTELSQLALDKAFPDTDVIPVQAASWSGIRITDGDFRMIEVTYEGGAVAQGATLRHVVPKEVGQSTVRVRTQPGSLGPCAGITGAAQFYEVRANTVELTPSGGDVRADQEITFTATVTDAKNLDLEFTATHGTFFELNYNPVSGVHVGKWRAPSKEQMPDDPITITARSLSTECLRQGVDRLAEGIFTPVKNEFVLDPAIYCIDPGGQQQFQVLNVKSDPVPPVTWELIGPGNLAPDGEFATYTAGQQGEVTIRATVAVEDEEPVVLEHSFVIDCGMLAALFFAPQDGPALGRTLKAQTATFLIDQGVIDGDVFFDYTALDPLAGAEPFRVARGEFLGTALFSPADPDEDAALRDDSEALRWYTVSTKDGFPFQYAVEAMFGLENISEDENIVLLPDGKFGDQMEIELDAGGSVAGPLPDEQSNEIVAYNWTFSDGTQLAGETVTKNFSRSLDELTITLQVVDKLGNWAQLSQTLIIVQVSGRFAFPFDPGGALTAGFRWEIPSPPPPPAETEDGYLVFIADPADCGMTLHVTGGRTTKVSATSSAAGRITEEGFDKYGITFVPFGLFDEE